MSVLLLISCEKEENPPPDSSNITVSSVFYGVTRYYVLGYSFELGEKVSSIPEGGKIADIIPEQLITPMGVVNGIVFSTPGSNGNGFYLNDEFGTYNEAKIFYDSYIEAEIENFSLITDTINPYQVYTFLTQKNNYVKFLIKNVNFVGSGLDRYVVVDLEYFIQRDGSTNLQ
jgi:hypothetical protein